MKGKHFFIENGKEIEIKEFDYEYVRNSLLKEYKPGVNRSYKYTVVVDRTEDELGNPIFDVRTLDLSKIYYNSKSLNIQDLMLDEIILERKVQIRDLPMPKLQKEYMDWKDGKIPLKTAPSTVVAEIPEMPKRVRKEVAIDDPRLRMVSDFMVQNVEEIQHIEEIKVLDWVDNFDMCNHEIALQSQGISEKKIQLAGAIKANSEYLHTVFDKLRVTLEELFPLKPSFMQRMFGNTELVVKEADLNKVLSSLKSAVQFDHTRFEGIKLMFESLNTDIKELQSNIDHGAVACSYQVAVLEDDFEWTLGESRLEKISITNEIMRTSLVGTRNQFMVDYNRMNEIQTVLIPLVVDRLQAQVNQKVDAETEKTIRALAYGAQVERGDEPTQQNDDY